ncbi:MAG TPA: hypothetical protein EYP14_07755 [Planctomycetaceae bacterium]|nr:hypothetical protein [Planctomycetaceae bacterium]
MHASSLKDTCRIEGAVPNSRTVGQAHGGEHAVMDGHTHLCEQCRRAVADELSDHRQRQER